MACRDKQQHLDRAEARAVLAHLKRKFREGRKPGWTKGDIRRLFVYRCPECRFWHLGKRKKPVPIYQSCYEAMMASTPAVMA